ncbi:unnamed protein product [Clavelina lepadiformis]|uniref:Connective tissue growth factor n=2 Tax=Clavelina lepadiformis TaxID=159417 RepID=A0ABP0EZN2_CLALP
MFRRSLFCLFWAILLGLSKQAISLCPYQCDCREEPSSCPAGVSLVMDGCNCCKVCAKQLAQQCNGDDAICDVHRNLFCDHSASRSGDIGICRARSGRPCNHGNVRISSGSMFEPSCKTRCWCMDGAIGCVPLCPHETQLPRPDRCPNARLQPVTGQCCDQWGCDTSSGRQTLPLEHFWSDYVSENVMTSNSQGSSLVASSAGLVSIGKNSAIDDVIYDSDGGADGDEIFDHQNGYDARDEYDYVTYDQGWSGSNLVPGEVTWDENLSSHVECESQASEWSPCSKSCGLGISTRVTNMNRGCELKRESRLCLLRPCTQRVTSKFGRKCVKQRRARRKSKLTYAGCVSLKSFKPKYCGSCHEADRCCTPRSTRTTRISFECPDGQILLKNFMLIRNCHCHRRCNSASRGSQHRPRQYFHLPVETK